VNLLPVLPLDGGNVVHSLLSLAVGRDAERGARYISIGVSGLGVLGGLALGYPFIVLLAGLALALNLTALSRHKTDGSLDVVASAQRRLLAGDAWGAVQEVEPLVSGAGPPGPRAAAADLQAWAWLLAGHPANARLALARRPPDAPLGASLQGALALADDRSNGVALLTYGAVHDPPGPDQLFAVIAAAQAGVTADLTDELLRMEGERGIEPALVLQSLLHRAGSFAEAAAVGSRLYRDGRADRAQCAYLTARSLARGGWLDDSLAWLEVALGAGWRNDGRLDTDPDLAPVRALPAYGAARRRHAGVP
jgi:hypothetical protein